MDRYIIIEGSIGTDDKLVAFKAEVNEKIKEGYTPIGSPIVAGDWIIQMMFMTAQTASLSWRLENEE